MQSGVRLSDGCTIRLEGARVAGRWLTSEPALERFIAAQTPSGDSTLPLVARTPTARRRSSEKAALQLEKLGI
jgi:hypothetical protein